MEPHRLVPLGRRWYLVAYDLVRHDWRSFRLDRLTSPRSTGARFRTRELPAADAAAFVRAGVEVQQASYTIEALVHAPASQVRERLARWATVEDDGHGRCVLRMTTDSFDWPAMALGSIGAEFEVISPVELAHHLREWSERFGRATVQVRSA